MVIRQFSIRQKYSKLQQDKVMSAHIRCPKCQADLPPKANFCPFCGKRLKNFSFGFPWLFAALAGAFWGAGLVLIYQIFKERRLWDEQESVSSKPSMGLEEDDIDDIMDF